MSVMYTVPSGAVVTSTGRNNGSSDLMNSLFGYDVVEDRQALLVLGVDAADDAADRFAVEIVADEILRQPMAAVDVVAGAAGDALQRSVRHARGVHAALHVGDANRRAPGNAEVRLELRRAR